MVVRSQHGQKQINIKTKTKNKKIREFQKKTSTFALLTTPNPLTVWITTKCGKHLKEMEIPDHLACLLRNLFAGQDATIRTENETTDWF